MLGGMPDEACKALRAVLHDDKLSIHAKSLFTMLLEKALCEAHPVRMTKYAITAALGGSAQKIEESKRALIAKGVIRLGTQRRNWSTNVFYVTSLEQDSRLEPDQRLEPA